jgi:hypothetical protein
VPIVACIRAVKPRSPFRHPPTPHTQLPLSQTSMPWWSRALHLVHCCVFLAASQYCRCGWGRCPSCAGGVVELARVPGRGCGLHWCSPTAEICCRGVQKSKADLVGPAHYGMCTLSQPGVTSLASGLHRLKAVFQMYLQTMCETETASSLALKPSTCTCSLVSEQVLTAQLRIKAECCSAQEPIQTLDLRASVKAAGTKAHLQPEGYQVPCQGRNEQLKPWMCWSRNGRSLMYGDAAGASS